MQLRVSVNSNHLQELKSKMNKLVKQSEDVYMKYMQERMTKLTLLHMKDKLKTQRNFDNIIQQ